MPTRLKNAALILGMVVVLVFAKYNLPSVTPFAQDPCDAVWAFAFTTILLIVVVSVVRVFRPYRNGPAPTAQWIFAMRLQQAFALPVFMTLVADVIALARHPSWISAASRNRLLAWLGILAAVVLSTQLVILAAQRTLPQDASTRWKRVALALAAAILLLLLSPEWPSDNSSQTAHILTVALGALVVFLPTRFLLPVLVPFEPNEEHGGRALFRSTASEWSALLVGVLMFAFGFWADIHKWAGTLRYMNPPILTIAPFLVAYALLGKPLGLVPKES
jgi:hypothetical protein